MKQHDKDCKGMHVAAGVYYCALCGHYTFVPSAMFQDSSPPETDRYKRVAKWMNRRGWPLLTLPVKCVSILSPECRLAADSDDFRSIQEMVRWMDERSLRGEGGAA
jgi:hypothetical protein